MRFFSSYLLETSQIIMGRTALWKLEWREDPCTFLHISQKLISNFLFISLRYLFFKFLQNYVSPKLISNFISVSLRYAFFNFLQNYPKFSFLNHRFFTIFLNISYCWSHFIQISSIFLIKFSLISFKYPHNISHKISAKLYINRGGFSNFASKDRLNFASLCTCNLPPPFNSSLQEKFIQYVRKNLVRKIQPCLSVDPVVNQKRGEIFAPFNVVRLEPGPLWP